MISPMVTISALALITFTVPVLVRTKSAWAVLPFKSSMPLLVSVPVRILVSAAATVTVLIAVKPAPKSRVLVAAALSVPNPLTVPPARSAVAPPLTTRMELVVARSIFPKLVSVVLAVSKLVVPLMVITPVLALVILPLR